MNVRFWGTRGSVPTPGPGTARYGGNTSCVEVSTGDPSHRVVLDAGTGIRLFGDALPADVERLDVLLTHTHMDHIIGLGFFAPLFRADIEVHLWGPTSTTLDLRDRLARYERVLRKRFPQGATSLADTGKLLALRLGLRHERTVVEWCEEALDTLTRGVGGTNVIPISDGGRDIEG